MGSVRNERGHSPSWLLEGPGPRSPVRMCGGKTKTSPGWRGLTPLVARCEPYRPRYRAGIATLLAFSRLAWRSPGQNPSATLDNVVTFYQTRRWMSR